MDSVRSAREIKLGIYRFGSFFVHSTIGPGARESGRLNDCGLRHVSGNVTGVALPILVGFSCVSQRLPPDHAVRNKRRAVCMIPSSLFFFFFFYRKRFPPSICFFGLPPALFLGLISSDKFLISPSLSRWGAPRHFPRRRVNRCAAVECARHVNLFCVRGRRQGP